MKIGCVQDFISEMHKNDFINASRNNGKYVVYRGEPNSKFRPIPSLFRIPRLNTFEYDQIHFLKASRFVDSSCELEIAIQAQHFGYPTRLLDVSFNSLVALFFSCYDKADIKDYDGKVYVLTASRFIPPTSQEMQTLYSDIILNADFFDSYANIMSPVIVENIKNNDRIIAQHGAFFLFLSDREIEKENYVEIIIDGRRKKSILKELDDLFEINEGTIFPDISMNVRRFDNLNSKFSYSFDFSKVSRIKFTLIELYIREMITNCEEKMRLLDVNSEERRVIFRRYYRNIKFQIDQYRRNNEVNSIELVILSEIEDQLTYLGRGNLEN